MERVNFTCWKCGCHVLVETYRSLREYEVTGVDSGVFAKVIPICEHQGPVGYFCGKCGILIARSEERAIEMLRRENMLEEE